RHVGKYASPPQRLAGRVARGLESGPVGPRRRAAEAAKKRCASNVWAWQAADRVTSRRKANGARHSSRNQTGGVPGEHAVCRVRPERVMTGTAVGSEPTD